MPYSFALEGIILLIDAHIHLPTGDQYKNLVSKKDRVLAELEQNGVDKCIVIADSWPQSEIGSNDEVVSLFPRVPDAKVFVVGGISPVMEFDKTFRMIEQFIERKQIVGIKLFTGHEKFYLTDDRLKPVYELAMRTRVPVLFHSGWDNEEYGDTYIAESVLQTYPGLQLVCCHCWYPKIDKCMKLIDYPNIAFDLSSVADDPGITDKILTMVRALVEAAPDRVMFGSDSFGCSMAEHIRLVKRLGLDPAAEQLVFAGNAMRIYGI